MRMTSLFIHNRTDQTACFSLPPESLQTRSGKRAVVANELWSDEGAARGSFAGNRRRNNIYAC